MGEIRCTFVARDDTPHHPGKTEAKEQKACPSGRALDTAGR
jgi:hypothetical protein